jgi:REP element-mobilizing transposase RayT
MEYEGAVYHVMNRGDRGEAIFQGEGDRIIFLKTLAETCERTGWEVMAYVLMGNHYHALIHTPEANLVRGMKWLQSTYTLRCNAWRRERGHLFQGRYKAVPVEAEEDGCLRRMADYIHLNPLRAGLIGDADRLESYLWSSYGWCLKPPSKRPAWLKVARVLDRGTPGHGASLQSAELHPSAGRRHLVRRAKTETHPEYT